MSEEIAKRKKNGCLRFVLIIFLLFCVGVGFGIYQISQNPDKYNSDRIANKYIDVNVEEGKEIDKILSECGITKVKNIKHDELLDNAHFDNETGYRIAINDEVDNVILYLNPNKTVYRIRYADYDLYSNKSVIATIQDYTFTSSEMSKLKIQCEDIVKDALKSPSTAKFPNILHWKFGKEKNIVTVQGYVDAQNSFGAESRSDFQFIIDTDLENIKSFIFDGEELIN